MRCPTPSLLSIFALLLAAGTLSGCGVMGPSAWVTAEEVLEFDLAGVERFSLLTKAGTIEAVATDEFNDFSEFDEFDDTSDGGDAPRFARLVVTVKAGGMGDADARDCLDAIELAVTRQGDTDEVQDIRWDYVKPRRPNWSAQVSYRLEVPPTIEVYAKAHNGKVAVTGVTARCELHSHNGPVEVHDAGADGLIAHTHNGRLLVTSESDHVDLHTHNGGIEATLTNPVRLSGNVSTHNGPLNVALNADSSAQLVCRTHNGRVKSDVPLRGVTVKKRTRLEGVLGQGGSSLELSTHNGSVTLSTLADHHLAVTP